MKSVFYVAENIHSAIIFIKSNTDWKQRTSISFTNGDEIVIVISSFMRFRGKRVDGVYIDHTFNRMEDSVRQDFTHRFVILGIDPITIKER